MEQVDPLWYGIFHCWCWASGGSWARVLSKVTSHCPSVLSSILTSFSFLGHICYHMPLGLLFYFQRWLGNLTGSLFENMVVFPVYPSKFYGGVGIKTFGKSRHPNLLCHILRVLLWLSSLRRRLDVRSVSLFPSHIQLFLQLCRGLLGPRVSYVQGLYPILAVCCVLSAQLVHAFP